METVYLGEWAWAALIGRSLVAISFSAALLSTLAYFKRWNDLGRAAFLTHAWSVFGVIALVFALFAFHRYEFQYIWKHLNNAMPLRFILSAFWGGQEGGFLMWMFWQNVLAMVFLRGARKRKRSHWTAPVMTTVSAVQAALTLMLLGVYFGDFQLGLDPFLLLREDPANLGLPWTARADYLTAFPQFTDGQGLNPLLQNYWMTIHPPTLFLGFSSTLIPFAYALAGLNKRKDRSWMVPALRWSVFGVGILGTGILMGGAWAYEALSFGGFWAWDPVENSSLVPWITLVASAHLLMINVRRKKSPTALFSTHYLPIISFLLVLYSTFLTKSGILGDTSVHSFVDSGILPQLLGFVLLFGAIGHFALMKSATHRAVYSLLAFASLAAVFRGYVEEGMLAFVVIMASAAVRAFRKDFARTEEEGGLWSREFWMFVGALLLVVSAVHITWQTSIPVFNHFLAPFSGGFAWLGETWDSDVFRSLSHHNFTPGSDFDMTYHRVQVPLAVLIMLLVGLVQWLKYKNTAMRPVLGKLLWPILATIATMLALYFGFDFAPHELPHLALLGASAFAVFSNGHYLISMLKGKWDHAGSPIAHIGFGLLILGAVLSTGQKNIISHNQIGDISSLNDGLNNREDLLLMQGDTLQMGPYFVQYVDKHRDGIHVKFEMQYYDRAPHTYKKGEVVAQDGVLFEAQTDHVASTAFVEDMEANWSFLPFPTADQQRAAARWKNGVASEPLFTLAPRIQLNEQMGNAPEPDTRHWLHKDLYTHIKWGRVTDPETDEQGWMTGVEHTLSVGDSVLIGGTLMTIDSLRPVRQAERPERGLMDKDLALVACLTLDDGTRRLMTEPLYIVRDSLLIPDLHTEDDWGLQFRIDGFDPLKEQLDFVIWQHESVRRDFVVMQAVIFPFINVLWIGCLFMAIGSFMAVRFRWHKSLGKHRRPDKRKSGNHPSGNRSKSTPTK